MNYHGKTFRAITNTENGETSKETIFEYKQNGNILTATYSGGKIKYGQLLGIVEENGIIEMRYHQINANNEFMTGVCTSTPEIVANGKIRLHEKWKWSSGDTSEGTSIIEEI